MQQHSSFRLRQDRARTAAVVVTLGTLALVACGGAPPPPPAATAPPKPAPFTAQQATDFYVKCWELFNTKAWDAFQNCYTPDATSDAVDSGVPLAKGRAAIIEAAKATVAPYPDVRGDIQLLLASGRDLLTVTLWKGTHTADLPGPGGKPIPATGKKVGFLMLHTIELDEGRTAAQYDADYVEAGTLLGQLGVSKAKVRAVIDAGAASPTVVLAKNDEAETKNVAVAQSEIDAFNKHDLAGVGSVMADGFVLHEIAQPADQDKKHQLMSLAALFNGFPDVKLTTSKLWGAGDYVAVFGTFDGTNSAAAPSMGLKKKTDKHVTARYAEVFRLENGKIVEDWLFYNGAAFAAQLGLM